jgi:acetoin utilization deacetylase AcuC-like enzyme
MKKIAVFYTKEQNVDDNVSFSPSAGKPKKVLDAWMRLHLPIKVVKPLAVTERAIMLAHHWEYVYEILSCEASNGFGNRLPSVAKSLKWTCGSIVCAAIHSIETGEPSVSLTSGFHHAGVDFGGGFCTFNGLVIASQCLRVTGRANRVGILDCDMHYANGTEDIIKRKKLKYISHYTFGGRNNRRGDMDGFIRSIPSIIRGFKNDGCEVLIYQAGADPHVNDPLGGLLTTEQMIRRDRAVFAACKKYGIPVVWNLAGGYQRPVDNIVELHTNTLKVAVQIYCDDETKESYNRYRKESVK